MPEVDSATIMPRHGPMIGNIELDVTMSETHLWSSQVTMVPVETGADRSQHIIFQPYRLEVEAVISDIPMDRRKQAQAAAFSLAGSAVNGSPLQAIRNQGWEKFQGGMGNFDNRVATAGGAQGTALGAGTYFDPRNSVGLATALQSIGFDPPEYTAHDRFRVALARMLTLRESNTPFDWISPLGVVENMVFQRLEVPIDTTQDFLFRASLIEYVETGIHRFRSLTGSQEDLSSDPDNIGSRTTESIGVTTLFEAGA